MGGAGVRRFLDLREKVFLMQMPGGVGHPFAGRVFELYEKNEEDEQWHDFHTKVALKINKFRFCMVKIL